MKDAITTYQAIKQQKLTDQWSVSLALFPKAFTLDVYYHIYQAVEEYEPDRTYGYRKRICANAQISNMLWGWVSKERNSAFRGFAKGCNKRNGKIGNNLGYGRVVRFNRLGCSTTGYCFAAGMDYRNIYLWLR